MAKEKKPISTLKKRNRLRLAHRLLRGTMYATPAVPLVVETAINWDEWFVESSQGVHVGFGFIFTVLSVLLTYFSIAKKKKIFEKYSAFWNVAVIVICWAIALIFLSMVIHNLGMILLYVGFSLVASAVEEEINERLVVPSLTQYDELVKKYGLDDKENRRKAKRAEKQRRAEESAREEAQRKAID